MPKGIRLGIVATTLAVVGLASPQPVLAAQAAPSSIRVGRSCSCRNCGTVVTVSMETYVKRVLPNEWIAGWHAESLKAGAIAIRSYAAWHVYHPASGSYDICDNTCCQKYGTTQYASTDNAADATAGVYLVDGAGDIMRAEYSAENNDSNGADGCGNCYISNRPGDGICLSDSVCCGYTKNGHGRGMCQWGSQRWAANRGMSYDWIIDHYYSAFGWSRQNLKVGGAIRAHWLALGGAGGVLGNPTTFELTTPDGIGRYNHFDGHGAGGSIYWTASIGAWEVHGAIRDKWAALGWETGPCGYPITDETVCPDGVGRFNHFNGSGGASIYWTPSNGAHGIQGAIRDKWESLGWEGGICGYPITDESTCPDGVGKYNHFSKNSSIYWSPSTGPWSVNGAIRDKWASLGWENSSLGYPVSDEYDVPGGRRSDFQNGSLVWDASTGVVTQQ